MCLDLGKGHFDWIEIRAIGRQEQKPRSSLFQDFGGFCAFVNGKVIQDDNVTWRERGSQLGLDIGIEGYPVHGVVNDPWGSQTIATQSGDEGLRSPMSKWRIHMQSLTARASTTQAHHLRVHGCFVYENKTMWFQPHHGLALGDPDITIQPNCRACAFRCHQGFFYM